MFTAFPNLDSGYLSQIEGRWLHLLYKLHYFKPLAYLVKLVQISTP